MTYKEIRQKLGTPVTTLEQDAWIQFFFAFVSLAVTAIPPYGHPRTYIFALYFAVSLLNGWRFLRKAKAEKAAHAETVSKPE
jgi:hypothetical protein